MSASLVPRGPEDRRSIATVKDYCEALLKVRDGLSDSDLAMLRAFCHAPENTLTATKLAESVNLASWRAANLRFGLLAQRIGQALAFTPSKRPNGTLRQWQSAAYGAGDDEKETGHFQWTLRPELVEAMKSMRWA